MNKFKVSQEYTGKEIGKIVKYGNYAFTKANKCHMYLTIGLVIGTMFEYYRLVLPIASILIVSLFMQLEKIEQSYKKYERVIGNEKKQTKVMGTDEEIIYINLLTDYEQEDRIKYTNIKHIVEIKEYIILVAETLTTQKYLLIPIKKDSIDISENDLKIFLIEKCTNLEYFKIAPATVIYRILVACMIIYAIIITICCIMIII